MWRRAGQCRTNKGKRRLTRHILSSLKRPQEGHDVWSVGPSSGRCTCASRRQRRERQFFRSKIGFCVDVCGIKSYVSEPSTDRIDVDMRPQKVGGSFGGS